MTSIHPEYQERLRRLMEPVNITSWRSLSVVAGVSIGQIRRLRQGQLEGLTLGNIDRLARALRCDRREFLAALESPELPESPESPELLNTTDLSKESGQDSRDRQPDQQVALQIECDRLHEELTRQAKDLTQRFQSQAIDQLESFLTFWPVAADRARRDSSLPAIKLVPLLKPIEVLLASWDVKPIGAIGEITAFDPSQHQPIDGQPHSGDRVRITHCGYRHGDRLLFRAKVSGEDASDS